ALPTEDGAEAAPPVDGSDDDDDEHEDVFVHQGAAVEDDHRHDGHVHHDDGDDEIDSVAEEEEDEGVADEQTVAASAGHIPEEPGAHVDTPEPEITDNIPDIQTASEQPGEQGATNGNGQALQAARPSQRWVRRRHYKIQE